MWKPAFFGVKPEVVLKGGLIAMANMGDPEREHSHAAADVLSPAIRRARPREILDERHLRQRRRAATAACSRTRPRQSGSSPVKNTRKITKRDLLWNDALPKIEVDPETYTVKADGRVLTCEPATVLPMAQRYFLF